MISSESFSKTGVISMKFRYVLVILAVLVLIVLVSCFPKPPTVILRAQSLNRESGEPIMLRAASNFFPEPGRIFVWEADKKISSEPVQWEPIDGRLFTKGNHNSEAVLYLPESPLSGTVRVRVSIVHEGLTESQIIDISYGETPGVLVEVFEASSSSFSAPDFWFSWYGTKENERTPVYFRYISELSQSVVGVPDPFESRIQWGVRPWNEWQIDPMGEVFIHGYESLTRDEYSLQRMRNAFDDVDIYFPDPDDGKPRNWRISVEPDLSSMEGWRVKDWTVLIRGSLSPTTSVYLVRAEKGSYSVTNVIDITPNLQAMDCGPEAVIVLEIPVYEDELPIVGTLWGENAYFGVIALDYKSIPGMSIQEECQSIDAYVVKGAQMVFSPDVSY